MNEQAPCLEAQIDQWRTWVLARQAITPEDAAELEDNLRGRVADLVTVGLDSDEAFLVAVRRMGNLDEVSREFAREHSERLWKQLVLVPDAADESGRSRGWRDLGVLLTLAVGAGTAVKAIRGLDDTTFLLSVGGAVLAFLAAYFAWSRGLHRRALVVFCAVAAVLSLTVNLYPFDDRADEQTFVLTATHLPVVLWLSLGVVYTGAWRDSARRMDFVRFTGELIIYFALIAMGGGLLMALTFGIFSVVDVDVEPFFESWILPFAAPGAFFVAAWLVEAKKSVVENMAPVLTRVFTPLTILLLVAAFAALVTGGPLVAVDRDLLILMDAVLVLVLALLLYSISARDPLAGPQPFDWLQLALAVAAFAVNVVALVAVVTRIADAGWTANKTAALGLNAVLCVHLVGAGWLLWQFLRQRRGFGAVERWQTRYLPVYAAWAAVVALAFPPLFSFT